jgi:hypothetical protein
LDVTGDSSIFTASNLNRSEKDEESFRARAPLIMTLIRHTVRSDKPTN